VTPKQHFPGELIDAYAPDSEGWAIMASVSNGISFAKRGAALNETYAAVVVLFDTPPGCDAERFLDFVKQRIALTNPAPRYVVLAEDYQVTEELGYPCVEVNSCYQDTEAVTVGGGTDSLPLTVVARYCLHPRAPDVGFFAAYSHRGKTPDANIEEPARRFIESIVVHE
jgi:hypothetical protein